MVKCASLGNNRQFFIIYGGFLNLIGFMSVNYDLICFVKPPTNFSFCYVIIVYLSQPTHMADFSQVQSIQTIKLDDGKGVLELRIAGANEPLTITCSSLSEAEDMADLIDGYCRLVHDFQGTFWTKKGNYPRFYL